MMEKPSKIKSKILASLPKAASAVNFQLSSPLSPFRPTGRKGFPGSLVSIIPMEARRKPKNSSFELREPASPKISCIGQVTNRKKRNTIKPKPVLHPAQHTTRSLSAKEVEMITTEKTKKSKMKMNIVSMMKVFKGRKANDGGDVCVIDEGKVTGRAAEIVPSLGGMQKFTSSCGGVLENFDWRIGEGRNEEQVANVIVPYSARKDSGGKVAESQGKQ